MKQLLILSGKGGTGKTTVASAFIKLLNTKVYADCDVDAPNLHITCKPQVEPTKEDFHGLPKSSINHERCIQCGKCISHCRFGALSYDNEVKMNPFACEGCGVCTYVCPTGAITMEEAVSGQTMLYEDEKLFSTAKLKMGSGATGKLVAQVKKNLRLRDREEVAIVDGSPGIGCPVIASLSGVDMVLIVTEPSVSGISDLKRIVETAQYFQVKTAVCINKFDIHLENTKAIQDYCKQEKINIVGHIPFDKSAVKAINQGKSVVELECISGQAIETICKETMRLLTCLF